MAVGGMQRRFWHVWIDTRCLMTFDTYARDPCDARTCCKGHSWSCARVDGGMRNPKNLDFAVMCILCGDARIY